MASSKPDLARAGTMQITAEEGKSYLERNVTEWKKPILIVQDEQSASEEDEAASSSKAKKPKLSKHTTMKGTAKEAAQFVEDVDEDAFTRGQQKKIQNLKDEKPTPKKARMARDNTMAATAKEGKSLVGKQKLGDTRQVTKTKKASLKRKSTTGATVSDAQAVYGDLDTSEGRTLRKRPKTPLKKAGTMQQTAKEGKAYLKRGKKKN